MARSVKKGAFVDDFLAKSIEACRAHCRIEIESLSDSLTTLAAPERAERAYPVDLSLELISSRTRLLVATEIVNKLHIGSQDVGIL